MRNIKASELILDFTLYPRNNVDSHNVRRIQDALAAGNELPPLVICRKTKRIADGFHRYKAHVNLYGEDAPIACIERVYKDDAALFLDAMKYNGNHGAALDTCDRMHCLIVAERLSLSLEQVAGALNVPADKLGPLRATRTATGAAGLSIPLKRTVRGFAGRTLTQRQEQANGRLSGMNQVFYCNQLIELIESDMLDTGDDQLLTRLTVLRGLLDDVLQAK